MMTRRISAARACVRVFRAFTTQTSMSKKRATWVGLVRPEPSHLLAKPASPLSRRIVVDDDDNAAAAAAADDDSNVYDDDDNIRRKSLQSNFK
jgi:hypothetical protein